MHGSILRTYGIVVAVGQLLWTLLKHCPVLLYPQYSFYYERSVSVSPSRSPLQRRVPNFRCICPVTVQGHLLRYRNVYTTMPPVDYNGAACTVVCIAKMSLCARYVQNVFSLTSVLLHKGSFVDTGHNITVVRRDVDWLICDDRQVWLKAYIYSHYYRWHCCAVLYQCDVGGVAQW